MLIIEFTQRGRVVWDNGRIDVVDAPSEAHRVELLEAVSELLALEQVDVTRQAQVKHALMSMGGAKLVLDAVGDGAAPHDGQS